MIAIVASSGSGKDTLLDLLTLVGYEPIVSYTTRPPRFLKNKEVWEKNGVAYHFISEEKFHELNKENFFAEQTEYRNWHYGVSRQDCQPGRAVVVEPNGLSQLQRLIKDVVVVFVDTSEVNRYKRLIARGDDHNEIERRIASDKNLFKNVKENSNIVFDNNGTFEDMVERIPQLVRTLLDQKYLNGQVII